MGSVHFMGTGVFGRNARQKTSWPGGTANQKKGLKNSGKEGEKMACGTSRRRKRNYNGRRQTGKFYSEGDLKCTGPIKLKGP